MLNKISACIQNIDLSVCVRAHHKTKGFISNGEDTFNHKLGGSVQLIYMHRTLLFLLH